MDPLLRKVQPLKRRRKRRPLSEEIHSIYKLLTITMLILGAATVGTYLYVNSTSSANGYTLEQLQNNYETLQSDQRKLDHQIIEAQSFLNIESDQTIYQMEESTDEDLSYTEDNSYAQNN